MRVRFYIQVIIVLLAAAGLASLYYYVTIIGLSHSREGVPGKLNQIIDDTTHYDVLFTGSSRVSRNIDPIQFSKATGYSSFNAGIDGSNMTLMTFVTKAFIRQHHPREVYINLDVYTMEDDSGIFYYPQYFPYSSVEGMADMSIVEGKLRLPSYAPFLAVSYLSDDLKGIAANQWLGTWPQGDEVYRAKGYEVISSDGYKGGTDSLRLPFVYDTLNFNKLDALCRYCRENNCHVFFIMAPIRGYVKEESVNHTDYYQRLRAVEMKYAVTELNYFGDTRFEQSDFYNDTHLNHKGARRYTQLLSDTLQALIAHH